jgi:hypothetical protein
MAHCQKSSIAVRSERNYGMQLESRRKESRAHRKAESSHNADIQIFAREIDREPRSLPILTTVIHQDLNRFILWNGIII